MAQQAYCEKKQVCQSTQIDLHRFRLAHQRTCISCPKWSPAFQWSFQVIIQTVICQFFHHLANYSNTSTRHTITSCHTMATSLTTHILTRRSQHSHECKDPPQHCYVDLWPFDLKINGFPGFIVKHLYVKFGDPSCITHLDIGWEKTDKRLWKPHPRNCQCRGQLVQYKLNIT